MQNVILLGAQNKGAVGRVVENLLAAGNQVQVTGELVPCFTPSCECPGILLARIEFKKPVTEETRAAKKAWSEKLNAAKIAAKTFSQQLQDELEPLP